MEKPAQIRRKGHLAPDVLIRQSDNTNERKEPHMFEELSEELLDLSANVRGHGGAVYAVVDDNSCSSSGVCSSVILCCTCTSLCW